MLGPLPTLHRLLLGAAAVFFFAGAGAWLVWFTHMPVVASGAAALGAAAGTLAAYLLVHDFSDSARTSPARRR